MICIDEKDILKAKKRKRTVAVLILLTTVGIAAAYVYRRMLEHGKAIYAFDEDLDVENCCCECTVRYADEEPTSA